MLDGTWNTFVNDDKITKHLCLFTKRDENGGFIRACVSLSCTIYSVFNYVYSLHALAPELSVPSIPE